MTLIVPVPRRPGLSAPDGHSLYQLPVCSLIVLIFVLSWVFAPLRGLAATQAQALVLDPFPEQHSAGYDGQDVVTLLQSAGFDVTVLHGSQVTVPVMRHLGRYALVYIYTHSGPLPNNDASVATGDTRHQRYAQYFKNYSLVQMHIAAGTGYKYFDAVTGRFIHRYSGTFSPHSIVFLNACTALGMPLFWKYLKESGVGTLISWEHHVNTADADLAAHDMFAALAQGETIAGAMHATQALGAGTSTVKAKIGRLAFSGDGKNTLQQAQAGATG